MKISLELYCSEPDIQMKSIDQCSLFISPDRTEYDRKKQRKLVVEMRKLCNEKPGMRHYIRSGIVISE